jgi:hypothetical protein
LILPGNHGIKGYTSPNGVNVRMPVKNIIAFMNKNKKKSFFED